MNTEYAFPGLIVAILTGVFFLAIAAVRIKTKFQVAAVLHAAIGWLVWPWILMGFHSVYLWNEGHVNDTPRTEQARPPQTPIRSSAAEKSTP